VTSIGAIFTDTRRGFGKCEYQFQVQAPAHESRKIVTIAGAI
jgi:hypothetical protein